MLSFVGGTGHHVVALGDGPSRTAGMVPGVNACAIARAQVSISSQSR
jgi:hypothetical protein